MFSEPANEKMAAHNIKSLLHCKNDHECRLLSLVPRLFLVEERAWVRGRVRKEEMSLGTRLPVTAVSGSIEQVDSLIKKNPKHNYHPSTPSQSKELAEHLSATQCVPVHLLAIIWF